MHLIGSGLISLVGYNVLLLKNLYQYIRSWTLEFNGVLSWVRKLIARAPNLLVISFSGMDCLTIPMQMTQLYMTMDHPNDDWQDGLARIELCVSEIRE